jgi:ABC-type transporter MlaC component
MIEVNVMVNSGTKVEGVCLANHWNKGKGKGNRRVKDIQSLG